MISDKKESKYPYFFREFDKYLGDETLSALYTDVYYKFFEKYNFYVLIKPIFLCNSVLYEVEYTYFPNINNIQFENEYILGKYRTRRKANKAAILKIIKIINKNIELGLTPNDIFKI
jgi:hypothetical protein